MSAHRARSTLADVGLLLALVVGVVVGNVLLVVFYGIW
ncbi:hypothetical protein HSB1_37060 [Halogranum salarium B-1]|uniref:Uncharacterized protein n=1 Tax=Halogranum salarium B-1 TaxID=1210908 RepID=J3JEE4_9EURY|nr:hypothetical protein HSB1_37060 [Halogranum salarium B-1]